MATIEILQIIWFVLIGVLLVGYSLLDGFDLGIGTLLPVLSKNENDTRILFNAIGPVWDGNEVWLLTGGGALFAAFPHVYATVFSGFYLALMIVLFALILRAVSLEFWSHDISNRGLWKNTFFIGSALPSILFGVALGNVILGVPLDSSMEYTGSFFTLLRPFPLATGLLGFTAILLQGTTYAAVKSKGDMQQRARDISVKIWIAYLILIVVAFIAAAVSMPWILKKPLAWICTVVSYAALIVFRGALHQGNDKKAFICSSIAFIGLWGIAGALQFPVLVRALDNGSLNMTIYNSSSTELTLKVMLIIAVIGMPLVITYTAMVYRIFKGKITLQ